jgi:hypothetical protein
MKEVVVSFDDGSFLTTRVSPEASFEDVIAYYPIGATINIGSVEDKLVKITEVRLQL